MANLFARPTPTALRHPETDVYVVPERGVGYDENDPLVKAFPWAFVTAQELAELESGDTVIETVERPVEAAEASPGRKRSTRRRG